MKNIRIAFCFIIFGLLFPSYVGATSVPLNKIVAKVNGEVITQSELDRKIAIMQRQLVTSSAVLPQASLLRQQVLDTLINNMLQLQLAKRNNIQLGKNELDTIVANIAKNNGVTTDQLKQSLWEREGIKFSEFLNQIREQVLISRVQQQFLGGEITVDDLEVKRELLKNSQPGNDQAQYHLTDILLVTPDNLSPDQLKTVTNLSQKMLAKLQQGASVEAVVTEGQDQSKKEGVVQVDDLGWRKLDELPSLFVKEVVSMKNNQVVGPLRAPNGLHLIKLLGVNSGSSPSLKITKEQAYEKVYHRQLMTKLKPWLQELHEKAHIEITK